MKHSKITLTLLACCCLLAVAAVGWADNCAAGAKEEKGSCGAGACGVKKEACAEKKACGAKGECKLSEAQATCPVMGGKINKELYVDQDGKRIYVCCGGCVKKVEKNFEKYEKKLEGEGVNLTIPQKKDKDAAKDKEKPA